MAPVQGMKDLDYLADQLDTRFRGPFGFRFGWDAILGLIPGLGDLVTSTFAGYIIWRAAAMGTPAIVLVRMGFNILIENILNKIPVIGLIFDLVWKANIKNVALLRAANLDRHRATWQSRFWVLLVLSLIFLFLLAITAAGFYLLVWICNYILNFAGPI